MRIGILTGSFLPQVGGMEWKVHYLASEYARAGHDVTVFAIRIRLGRRHQELPIIPSYRVIRTGLTARGFGRFGINTYLFNRSVMREHRRHPFDVLHCHPVGLPSYCGAMIKTRIGPCCVVTTSGGDIHVDPSMDYGDRLIPYVERMIRYTLRHADVIGCVSDAIRATLEQLGAAARLVDIPNGVNWEEFQIPRDDHLRRLLNIRADQLIVLSVGRNTPIKDFRTSMNAFRLVAEKIPGCVYVIVGRGVSKLRNEPEAAGLNGRIHFVEQVPIAEIPRIMRSADIFMNTSLMEGFAQVNAQALASGLPCVITDSPGNVDAAKHGGALVAQTGNPHSISDALSRLLQHSEERSALSRAAHEAGKQFDWRRIARQYLDIFEELVRRKSHQDRRVQAPAAAR